MDEEGEEPFVALDSLLEVNLVEDTTGSAPTLAKGDSFKDCGQECGPNRLAEDAVSSSVSYAKNTGLNNCMPDSNLDPVQIAWGMDLEEDMFYKDLFKDVSTVQYLRLHCTVCDAHLGCKPGSVLMRHVRLGTLLCKDCFTFYGAGEFPIAEDGSESFCYWCGQGGNVICCSSCSAVFCKKCIKLNYTKSTIKEIESSTEWMCFVCNYRSLWEHRAVCRAAITYESSGPGSLKEDEENTPGRNQEFCCGPSVERRIPRLKSNMPSEVTFGEYIKAGRVKASVMKMLRNIPLDSNEDIKTEKIILADPQATLAHSAASKEMVSSEQSVTASHSKKERPPASVTSHNISYVDVGPLISQTHFPTINPQPTTGLPFFNQGVRPNIISNSQVIPSGRVVVMPPVHIPHRTSVIRLPQQNSLRLPQQNSPVDALSLGALLSSSPSVGAVPQPPNQVFRFQSGTSPMVVVRSRSGAYVPMYVNNSANIHYVPKEASQISGVPHYVQNQGTNAIISHPHQQQERLENNIKFPLSSVVNNAATYQPNINGQTSQNLSSATLAHTAKSYTNSSVNSKSKTKSGYIQVRSPTALQSVTVSDIEHSPLAVSESVTHVGTEQQAIHNSLFPGCPSETVPSVPTSLPKDQSMLNSLLTESQLKKYPQNKPASRLASSTANLEGASMVKSILNNVSPDSSNSVNNTFPSKEVPQANIVNQTSAGLPSRSIGAVETNWFKENLLEAENVAKYMLTRITCIQEELDGKSHQKQVYDEMINNFNKLLETAGKKLTDVIRSFTINLKRWKPISPSCHADLSQGSQANTDQQSSVETKNGHNNTHSHEEVEIISAKGRGKRKSSNSESQISPPVTCSVEPCLGNAMPQDATSSLASATAQDTTSSGICTDASEAASQAAKPAVNTTHQPRRMFSRRSKSTKSAVKCCSSCEPDQQLRSKQVGIKQNTASSRTRSERLDEQEKSIPEKRRKLKDLRVVLERIHSPGGIVFKRELNDNHSTSDSNAPSQEAVAAFNDRSYLRSDDLVKQLKPCSVVIHKLNQRDITHCI